MFLVVDHRYDQVLSSRTRSEFIVFSNIPAAIYAHDFAQWTQRKEHEREKKVCHGNITLRTRYFNDRESRRNEHTELDLEQYNIPASDSLSMAFNAARTGPIRILSCAADSRWWSWDDLKGNFNADEWSCDMTSVDSSRSLNNKWHVSLAPGSASWFSTPKNTTE